MQQFSKSNRGVGIGMVALLAATATCMAATPVPIVNAGFEDPTLSDGDWTADGTIVGWTQINGGDTGVWNVTTADFPAEAPEGANVAYVYAFGAWGVHGSGQVLSGPEGLFQLDASYSLTVQVGNSASYAGFPGYQVQLLAGGTVIAEDDNTSPPDEGEFVTSTVNYTYNPAHSALVGQPLEIRLLSKGEGSGEGIEIEMEFDDVRLAAPTPHPIANAGGPYIVAFGGSLSLNGTNSAPSDGASITNYSWDLNNDGTFGDVIGATPGAIPYETLTNTYKMVPGANTIKLRVTDSSAQTSTNSTTVTLFATNTTVITGTSGGDDSWNQADNWSAGIPFGPIDAVVMDGVSARVNNAATPVYSGSLTLMSNATLTMAGAAGSENAVLGVSGITMQGGSKIQVNLNANITFPPITMAGDASLESLWGASDWQTDDFAAITGPYTLTISGFNGHTYNLNAANGFSKLVCNAIDRHNIRAKAAGALGTGDVVVNPVGVQGAQIGRSARLYFDVPDAIADTATLYLNGPDGVGGWDGNGVDWVVIDHAGDEKISALYIYGVKQPPGTYTSAETWLGGSGTLTVEPIAPVTNLVCTGAGNDVTLTWATGAAYDSIEVREGGTVLATLAGTATQTTLTAQPNGAHTYSVTAVKGGMTSAGVTCSVTLPVNQDTILVFMGNANGDNTVNIADAVTILGYLFGKPPKPAIPCFKAADTNDDNTLNVADAIDVLTFLFGAQTNPSKPMTGPDGLPITAAACRPYPAADIPATIIEQPGCATPCQ